MRDLRFYVHDVELMNSAGDSVPFQLEADNLWQSDRVALLDYTGTSSDLCADRGTEGKRNYIVGTVPADTYTKIKFKLGVPKDLNHLNGPNQVPPLNESGMWWSWAGGYRF